MSPVEISLVVKAQVSGVPKLQLQLFGLSEAPADPRFSIIPAGESAADQDSTEPIELFEPEAIEVGENGVLLDIGTLVAERARLSPGQTVLIEVPAALARCIAEWPDLSSLAHASPAHPSAHDIPAHDPLGFMLAEKLRRLENESDRAAAQLAGEPAPLRSQDMPGPPAAKSLEEAQQQLTTIVSRIMNYEAGPERGAEPPAVPPVIAAGFRSMGDGLTAARIAAAFVSIAPEIDPQQVGLHTSTDASSAGADDDQGDTVEDETAAVAQPDEVPEPPHPRGARKRDYPIARYNPKTPVDAVGRRMSMAALALAGIAAVAAVCGLVAIVVTGRSSLASPSSSRVAAMSIEAKSTGGASEPGTLADVFSIAPMSPKGRSRRGVDLDAGLTLADQYLSGGGEGDRTEGEYWLKHALSSALGDERLRWALTQLGSGYAAGTDGTPDYGKARLLWEMAGQLGDPIALCFLGTLYERGLGVNTDRGQALTWYARAKQAGGCPGIDGALTRVGQQ